MKKLTADRFRRSLNLYDHNAIAQRRIVDELLRAATGYISLDSRLDAVLEVGCGTGLLSSELLRRFDIVQYSINDLCTEAIDLVISKHSDRTIEWERRPGDAASILGSADKERYSLIASSSTLQWLDSPMSFLSDAVEALRLGGVLLLSTFAPGNIGEFTALTGQGLDYLSVANLEDHLRENTSLTDINIYEDEICLYFHSPQEVLAHMQYTGVTGTTAASQEESYWTPGRYRDFCCAYMNTYGTPEGVRLTYRPLYLLGCKA